jgi:ABC-type sugar transport system ATPase subunit
MSKEILRMQNISKHFGGVTALKDVDMTINEGILVETSSKR